MILKNTKHRISLTYNLRGKYVSVWCPTSWLEKAIKEHKALNNPLDTEADFINISFIVDKVQAGSPVTADMP